MTTDEKLCEQRTGDYPRHVGRISEQALWASLGKELEAFAKGPQTVHVEMTLGVGQVIASVAIEGKVATIGHSPLARKALQEAIDLHGGEIGI